VSNSELHRKHARTRTRAHTHTHTHTHTQGDSRLCRNFRILFLSPNPRKNITQTRIHFSRVTEIC